MAVKMLCFSFVRRFKRQKLSLKPIVLILILCILFIYRHALRSLLYTSLTVFESETDGTAKNSSFKYILLWSSLKHSPFPDLIQEGIFAKNNCSFQNCIVTTDRNYFMGDLSKFDAVAINGRKVVKYKSSSESISRGIYKSLHQKYIYVNTGSAWKYPVCSFKFDNLFNWTMTYKLNSDVPYPYIQIRDKAGNIVGPKIDMVWEKNMTDVDQDVRRLIEEKTKAVAWFVSGCHTATKREELYMGNCLKNELQKLGYDVDIFGSCGKYRCQSEHACNKKLKEYYFLLAYEQYFAEDFVTPRLLRALMYYTVPIVYGGADYSRFLPPDSYLNARYTPASRLAVEIRRLIKNPHLYRRYFGWRKHYTYHDPMMKDNVCALCAAMHNPELAKRTEYPHLRTWWNPAMPNRCQKSYINDGILVKEDVD